MILIKYYNALNYNMNFILNKKTYFIFFWSYELIWCFFIYIIIYIYFKLYFFLSKWIFNKPKIFFLFIKFYYYDTMKRDIFSQLLTFKDTRTYLENILENVFQFIMKSEVFSWVILIIAHLTNVPNSHHFHNPSLPLVIINQIPFKLNLSKSQILICQFFNLKSNANITQESLVGYSSSLTRRNIVLPL